MGMLYPRELYLRQLRPFYRSDLIKVIAGVRRCGKSCLMHCVADELRRDGVEEKDIIFISLDKRGYKGIKRASELERAIDDLMVDDGKYKYLFIDEVQNVEGFEGVLNAYREEGNISIFITGSNSYLLSGELATKLTGRYVQVDMFTLTFDEYLGMKKFLQVPVKANLHEEFADYIRTGGFPKAVEFPDMAAKTKYVEEVVKQIIAKDIRRRCKVNNAIAFDKVITYVINNFGARTSLKGIEDYFRTAMQMRIKQETIKRYVDILESAKILYRCPRFDMKSRRSLSTDSKYYLADTGIYFSRNVDGRINYGPVLENILYAYLASRGYKLSVGQIGKTECDFIARKDNNYFYIQVAMTIADPATEEREYRSLNSARDHYPRYLFTLDTLLQTRDGVMHVNLIDFIAAGREL